MKDYMIVLIIWLFLSLVIIGIGIFTYLYDASSFGVEKVVYSDKVNNDKTLTASISLKENAKDTWCILKKTNIKPNVDDPDWILSKKAKCEFKVDNKINYYLFVKDYQNRISKSTNIKIDINKNLKMFLSKDKVYLPLNGTKKINVKIDSIGKTDDKLIWKSSNSKVVSVKNGLLKGLRKGVAKINVKTTDGLESIINVVVTDLITMPTLNTNKRVLPCKVYSKKETQLLDDILLDRIKEAGYGTRAGVVAALRFILLEFPYRVEYFYENGRLNNTTGGSYVDGEGRYYHKGLYLDDSKFKNLKAIHSGPAIWGCPLTNYQQEYGYIRGTLRANGLDCSGFISWAFYNGGFDVKDTGAGDNPNNNDDLADLGPRLPITYELMTSGKVKAGDIIAKDGHIALVIGIDNDYIYIAESTVLHGGINISTWSLRDTIISTPLFTYVILLDDLYKKQGNYKNMW